MRLQRHLVGGLYSYSVIDPQSGAVVYTTGEYARWWRAEAEAEAEAVLWVHGCE